MAFNEKDNEKLGLILSTVGASIGNWAISQKSMQTQTETSNGENDPPLDFESLKRAICQAVDMLRMFPGFKASMPKSSSSQAVAQIESEATILFPSRFRSPNGDSLSSFEATSLVSSSCRFSDDENSNSSPATASSSEVDMGVSESQEKIDIKQESYSPLEKEPNDKTPTKQRQRTNSSSSSSSWCVTPLRKRHWCNHVDDYDDYEDSERTSEHRLSNKKNDSDTGDEEEEGEWVEKKSKSLSETEWDDDSVNSPKSKKFRTADTGLNGTSNVLYVANFSLKTTSEDLKALSPDIREVKIISLTRFHRIGFLEFDSNEKAVENLKRLDGKFLAGQQLFLRVSHSKQSLSLSTSAKDEDYRHRKSSKHEEKKSGDKRNSLYILHLANLSTSVTTHDLKKKFSDSEWVFIYKPNGCQTFRASILYSDEILCKKAKNVAFGMKLKGRQIYASYGLYTGDNYDESVTGRPKDRSRSRSINDEPLKQNDLRKLLLKDKDFERSPKADKIESAKKSSGKVPYRRVILPSELLKIYK